MTLQDTLQLRCLGWADMLTTGIDERQLRGAIDRGLINLGEKGRNGRLMFSVAERFAARVAHELTLMEIPIKLASFVANKVQRDSRVLLNYHCKRGSQKQGRGPLTLYITRCEAGFSVEYAVGGQKYRPGRGVDGDLAHARTAVTIDLSDLLDEMETWISELSHSQEVQL